MARIITTLHMPAGSQWLLRLDQINAPAGRVADRHQHPGPGIRCLLEGTFNVQQDAESVRDVAPGEAWWETGADTVIAWGSRQMATRFMRGMVLPVECEGKADRHLALGRGRGGERQGQLEALRRSGDYRVTVGLVR